MTANVKLIVGEKANVLKVPTAALRFRPAGISGETPGPTPALGASGGGGEGPASSGNTRDHLTQSLGLSEEQQRKLDLILEGSRQALHMRRVELGAGVEQEDQVASRQLAADVAAGLQSSTGV